MELFVFRTAAMASTTWTYFEARTQTLVCSINHDVLIRRKYHSDLLGPELQLLLVLQY